MAFFIDTEFYANFVNAELEYRVFFSTCYTVTDFYFYFYFSSVVRMDAGMKGGQKDKILKSDSRFEKKKKKELIN